MLVTTIPPTTLVLYCVYTDFSCWLHLLDGWRARFSHCSFPQEWKKGDEKCYFEGNKCQLVFSNSFPSKANICIRRMPGTILEMIEWSVQPSACVCVEENALFVWMCAQWLIIEYTYTHRIRVREMAKQIYEMRK